MANIQFIGRKEELAALRELSKNDFFLIVRGRRRIGKTSLLRKALPNAVYIFVWPDKSIDWILQQISEEQHLPHFRTFGSLVEYLLEQEKTVILDEFQNFLNVDKSVYGEIQAIIDRKKLEHKPYKLAAAGSSYSLMNKVFYDSASPLYGRKTHEINLAHIDSYSLFNELGLPLQEFIELWSVFEGVPYYYELVDVKKSAKNNIYALVLSQNSQLKEEGKAILSIEFGKDSKTYNTVLTAISEGKTKLNEIASLFGNRKNEVVKYIDILRKDFNLVRKITPICDNPEKSRMGNYEIIDNFLSFWFYFYDKHRTYVEQERFEELREFFNNQLSTYVGRKFEKFIIALLKDKKIFPSFTKIGKQWGRLKEGTYEIDIAALHEATKEILLCECKWSNNVNALTIVSELEKKSAYVTWNLKDRKESYAIFAKSFSKKIESLNGKKVHCFDLHDIENIMKKR